MATSTPPAKRLKLDFSEDVTILVGKEEKKYTIHKCFATASSEFLSKALSGDWKEAKDCVIKIPECEPRHFNCYIQWLYTTEIVLDLSNLAPNVNDNLITSAKYGQIMAMYKLGYFLLDTKFRNALIDATIEVVSSGMPYPGHESIRQIWNETPPDCTMKRLIIRYWVTKIRVEALNAQSPNLPKDFNECLLLAFITLRDTPAGLAYPTFEKRCDYHEYDDRIPKCS